MQFTGLMDKTPTQLTLETIELTQKTTGRIVEVEMREIVNNAYGIEKIFKSIIQKIGKQIYKCYHKIAQKCKINPTKPLKKRKNKNGLAIKEKRGKLKYTLKCIKMQNKGKI